MYPTENQTHIHIRSYKEFEIITNNQSTNTIKYTII